MKSNLFLLSIGSVMVLAPIHASAQSMQLWSAYRDLGSSSDVAMKSQTDANGNTYVLAETPRSSGPDVALCRFNYSGGVNWTRILSNSGPDHADALALMPSGGAAIACSLFDSTSQNSSEYVKRYDSSGNVVFSYGPVQPGFRATCMAAASDNSTYVAGSINGGLRILHLSATGGLIWSTDISSVDVSGSDQATGLAIDGTGSVWVTGALWNGITNLPAIWEVSSTGNLILGQTVSVDGQDSGQGNAILIDPKGPIFVVGTSSVNEVSRGWLAAFDSTGNQTWVQTTESAGFYGEEWDAVGMDPYERVVVAGSAMTSSTNRDMYVARYAIDSTPIWSTTYDGPGNGQDAARWLAIDKWGYIFVGGRAQDAAGREDYAVLKLAPTGVAVWPASGDVFYDGAAIFDGDGANDNTPCALGLDSRDNAYIAGSSVGSSGGYDLSVVKYGLTDDSAFVQQNVPTSMVAGWPYSVSVEFQNTGDTVWTNSGGYRIDSQNPSDNSVWGLSRMSVPFGSSIAGGQAETFNFKVNAPINGGTYNFQWRMNNSLVFFGAPSVNVPVTVTELPDAALFVWQSIPTTVKVGSTFTVSVKMRNVGSNAWTYGDYSLVAPSSYANWAIGSVNLSSGETIVHGAYKTFTFTCVAPSTAGSYKMKWQMSGPNGAFDQATMVKMINVTS